MVNNAASREHLVAFEQLLELQRDPQVTVVDVLAAESYAQAHIPGAVNVPLSRLKDVAAERLPHRERTVVTYCAGFS